MTKSAFEMNKDNSRTSIASWLRETPIVAHGYITEVIDMNTVKVRQSVQRTDVHEIYTVRLLSFGSGLKEDVVYPRIDDTVLLLFLQRCDPAMFEDVAFRRAGPTKLSYVKNTTPYSYDKFSGIGILARLVTGRASDVTTWTEDSSGVSVFRRVMATVKTTFNKAFSLVFDSVRESSGEAPTEQKVSVSFGSASPLSVSSKSGATMFFKKPVGIELEDEFVLEALSVSITGIDSVAIVTEGDMDLVGDAIHLNGDTKKFVTHTELDTAIQTFVTSLNANFATKLDGGGAPGVLTLNIANAATSTVLTGG